MIFPIDKKDETLSPLALAEEDLGKSSDFNTL